MKKSVRISISLSLLTLLLFCVLKKESLPIAFFQITSGSMMPQINVGEIIILVKQDEYKKNDVITYKDKNSFYITHRIVRVNEEEYTTKGDYNNTEDNEKVKKEQIKGKVILHSKILGILFKFRGLIVVILIFLLIIL